MVTRTLLQSSRKTKIPSNELLSQATNQQQMTKSRRRPKQVVRNHMTSLHGIKKQKASIPGLKRNRRAIKKASRSLGLHHPISSATDVSEIMHRQRKLRVLNQCSTKPSSQERILKEKSTRTLRSSFEQKKVVAIPPEAGKDKIIYINDDHIVETVPTLNSQITMRKLDFIYSDAENQPSDPQQKSIVTPGFSFLNSSSSHIEMAHVFEPLDDSIFLERHKRPEMIERREKKLDLEWIKHQIHMEQVRKQYATETSAWQKKNPPISITNPNYSRTSTNAKYRRTRTSNRPYTSEDVLEIIDKHRLSGKSIDSFISVPHTLHEFDGIDPLTTDASHLDHFLFPVPYVNIQESDFETCPGMQQILRDRGHLNRPRTRAFVMTCQLV